MDEGTREETPPHKMPSFLAMLDLATKDDTVKKQLHQERMSEAEADFLNYRSEFKDIKAEAEQLINKIDANGLFTVKPAAQWIEQAKNRPIPKMLFGEFWFEGELCILFADTNLGKSILAVQIGNSISKGESIPGFTLQAIKQPVLYFDFEMSEKQFENRYSNNFEYHYCFDGNLIRLEINPDAAIPENISLQDFLYNSIEKTIIENGAKVLIVDNITYLKNETEKARDALPLMKRLFGKYH